MPYKLRYILFCLLCLSIFDLKAQDDPDPNAPLQQQNINTDEQLKTKLGVKFTIGNHTFRGTAFENPKLTYGFGGGIYNIVALNKKKTFNLHWELNLNFKGSKFGQLNDTSYSKISLAYLELPVMASIQIANTPKKQPLHLLVGFQAGLLFRSSINKAYGKFGEVKTNLPFKPFDYAPVIGLRKDIGSGMSIQLMVKPGIFDIWTNKFYERSNNPDPPNTNVDYWDLTPKFKDGSYSVKNFSVEFSFLF